MRRAGFFIVAVLVFYLVIFNGNEQANAKESTGVENSGFELTAQKEANWDDTRAIGWNVWKPTGNPTVYVTNENFHSGSYALKIAATKEGRAAVSQDVQVEGGQTYKFSAWIKTENVTSEQGARLRATYYTGNTQLDLIYSSKVTGTNDWTYIEEIITPPKNVDRIRVQNFLERGTGTAFFDDVTLTKITPLESIDIKEDSVTVEQHETINLDWSTKPQHTNNRKIDWISSDNSIAKVKDGVVTGINTGETAVFAVSESGNIKDYCIVKVKRNPKLEPQPIQALELTPEKLELNEGQYSLLDVTVKPEKDKNENPLWESSNKEVAVVQDGLVKAVGPGSTTILIKSVDGSVKAESKVSVSAYQEDEFDELRYKWNESLLGLKAFDEGNTHMREIIANKTKTAKELWITMNKNSDREYLWMDLSSNTDPGDITYSYRNLYKMAEMFVTESSSLYHNPELLNDIIAGLDWMYQHRYNANIPETGNWWHWEIGAPRALNNITSILYNYLDSEKIQNYMSAVDHFQPDPTKSGATTPDKYRESLGANRIDTSKVVVVRGIIVKDAAKIAASRDALSQVFKYVTEGNGFYRDGSFVQHEDIAYNGSYGIVLIEGLTELFHLLSNSTWEVTDPYVEHVYSWISESFEPFMYKGSLMDMVRGRAISRSFLQEHQAGHTVIQTVLRMSQFAPEPYATEYKKMAKYWIQEDSHLNYLTNLTDFNDINLAEKLLKNDAIKPRGELLLHKTFANMDRVVTRKPGYAFGISMYSDRIQNYEDMNNENRKGWYTGEGMTYLYNNDLDQFSDGFWPTVDPYRLPGTTVDTMARADGSGEHRSDNSWVGGSTLANMYGTAGMNYSAWNSSLTAKKSWFMFDDEIVALGAGISSKEDRNIETIVENRKIGEGGINQLSIDGEKQANLFSQTAKKNVNWAFLEGTNAGSDIGYYFPAGGTLQVKKEEREGSWSDINYKEPEATINRAYATMWFDHGVRPTNKTYSYVLLPKRSENGVAAYANDPEIEILRNDDDVQAVRETSEQLLGANFWKNEKQTAGPLTAYQKASVTMKHSGRTLDVSLADPTMKNSGVIELEIAEKAYGVIAADERVKVEQIKPTIRLKVDVNNAKGESIHVKFNTDSKQSNQTDQFAVNSTIVESEMDPNSTITANIDVESKTGKKAVLTLAFYDWKGNIKEYVNEEIKILPNNSNEYQMSLKLPDYVSGGTVRAFVWKGKQIEGKNYKLLSNVDMNPDK
ncbi:polysaccharide lyase family 8 super-sandwich domain-containing protein [Virgibacillus halodenitrificans]|uniref:polysaccharide lyase family 8 super-sandwich domain-containing protein n=1 Tax=Virgibacillus halodenitrificans TaxID=1482 RepID=UPI002DB60A94|nr:polysaccharide lyase family 8 super-sandwich domain-containing protein [Virgibacillus halodenitrificans]MEC2158347.1 polysaccharide lyase family 8 super-sandwich domain-containing protein [Virgibacillus halodenitrificans]